MITLTYICLGYLEGDEASLFTEAEIDIGLPQFFQENAVKCLHSLSLLPSLKKHSSDVSVSMSNQTLDTDGYRKALSRISDDQMPQGPEITMEHEDYN